MHAPRHPDLTPEKNCEQTHWNFLKTDPCSHGNENLGILTQNYPYFNLHRTYGQSLVVFRFVLFNVLNGILKTPTLVAIVVKIW